MNQSLHKGPGPAPWSPWGERAWEGAGVLSLVTAGQASPQRCLALFNPAADLTTTNEPELEEICKYKFFFLTAQKRQDWCSWDSPT